MEERKLQVPGLQIGYVTRKNAAGHSNEDRHCDVDLQSRLGKEALARHGGEERMWFWSVFDGHGGAAASEYTSKHLIEHVVILSLMVML